MFGQIIQLTTRTPERHKHTQAYVVYNHKGKLIRGSYDIPEGTYPVIYVPLFAWKQIIQELDLNRRVPLTEEERLERKRESLRRYRERKRIEKESGKVLKPLRPTRVLPPEEVLDIKRLIDAGYKNTEIATMKEISDSMVSRIRHGKRRADILEYMA